MNSHRRAKLKVLIARHAWLIAYVVMIPVFAALYASLPPGALYFPTARLEPDVGQAYDLLLASLTRDLRSEPVLPLDGANAVETKGWTVESGTVRATSVLLREGAFQGISLHHREDVPTTIKFVVRANLPGTGVAEMSAAGDLTVEHSALLQELRWPRWLKDSVHVESLLALVPFDARVEGFDVVQRRIGVGEIPLPSAVGRYALLRQVLPDGFATLPDIKLSPTSRALLLRYVRALLGFPSDKCDNFWRVLYASAVTITTLGFGDVVPLSGLARFLIGLEAVVGVVFLGMYFSSIARGVEREMRSRASPS